MYRIYSYSAPYPEIIKKTSPRYPLALSKHMFYSLYHPRIIDSSHFFGYPSKIEQNPNEKEDHRSDGLPDS
jgi:hypothetical protein